MEENYSIKTLIKYIIIIVVVLVAFYGLTIIITNNKVNDTQPEEKEETIIDYDTILANSILNQKEDSYYVFASTSKDDKSSDYKAKLISYDESENALKVYYVDLDSAFNKNYLGDTSNFSDDLTFSGTTLLKIEDKKIKEHYEGSDIETFLSTLANQ